MDFIVVFFQIIVFKILPDLLIGAAIWFGIVLLVNFWQSIHKKGNNNHKEGANNHVDFYE